MPEMFQGVPVAPEKAGRGGNNGRRRPQHYIGLKDDYETKYDQFGIPVPSKNINAYELPVNTKEGVVLLNDRPQNEMNRNIQIRLRNAAIAEYKKRFRGALEESRFQKGFQALKNAGVVKKLNFGEGPAPVPAPVLVNNNNNSSSSSNVARALFRKTRKSKKSRKARKATRRI